MRLDKLYEQGDVEAALRKLEKAAPRSTMYSVLVHAYVVGAFYRRPPKRRKRPNVIQLREVARK